MNRHRSMILVGSFALAIACWVLLPVSIDRSLGAANIVIALERAPSQSEKLEIALNFIRGNTHDEAFSIWRERNGTHEDLDMLVIANAMDRRTKSPELDWIAGERRKWSVFANSVMLQICDDDDSVRGRLKGTEAKGADR